MAYRIKIEKQGTPYPYDNGRTDGSLEELPEISTKIKPIDKEKANSEIEKGELVLDPNTGAIHKALGKPHSKGGTPVSLKDGSFIFSNYKKLAINKNEKEVFEFKLGGKKEKDNTPSRILEKEIDIKHHNKMIDIMQNEKKYTKETANSAKLMMMKNLEKAGQVAYLQESKKGIQEPAFAQGTAPVYSKETDEQINQSMQYLQRGGRKLTDAEIQAAEQNPLKDVKGWNFLYEHGIKKYYGKPGSNGHKATPAEEAAYAKYLANETPEQKIKRKSREAQQKVAAQFGFIKNLDEAPLPRTPYGMPNPITPAAPYQPKPLQLPPPTQMGNPPGNPSGVTDPTTYDSKLTPWQKINIGIPFYKALTVKTQYPLRQHQESVIPQMDNISSQPQENAINQGYFNASKQVSEAGAQELYGRRTDALLGAIGSVQQQNVGTQNQQKVMAAQSLNNDAAQNRQFDRTFYDQTQTAIKNRDELRQAYTTQGINNLNDTMTKKLAFDSWLNSQQQYKGNPTFVDKDGVQHYQGQALYTPKAGFWGNTVQYNSPNIDWSTYQRSTGNKVDSAQELGQAYMEAKQYDDTLKFADFLKFKGLSNYNTNANSVPPSFKRGGKYRKKSC